MNNYPRRTGLRGLPPHLLLITPLLLLSLLRSVLAELTEYPDGSICVTCVTCNGLIADNNCYNEYVQSPLAVPCEGYHPHGNECGPNEVKEEYLSDTGMYCYSSNKCEHTCSLKGRESETKTWCCFVPGSSYIRDFYSRGSDSTPHQEGVIGEAQPPKGVGIQCKLVSSAATAYNSAKSTYDADPTANKGIALGYYFQVLSMACLRSSHSCRVPECPEVEEEEAHDMALHGCVKNNEPTGGEFEEEIFRELIEDSKFGDVQGRLSRVQDRINELVKSIENREIGSPFLNLMLAMNGQVGVSNGDGERDTRKLVQAYYSAIQVFEDLQPIFERYIRKKVPTASAAPDSTVKEVSRWHAQFLKCGFAPSYATQAKKGYLTPANAAIASLFIPLAGVQLRNSLMFGAMRENSTMQAVEFATIVEAELPVSEELRYDIRNWIYRNVEKDGGNTEKDNQGGGNANGESAALLEQALGKAELSDEKGTNFDIKLNSTMEILIKDRTDGNLQDKMAMMGLFFPTANGKESMKPIRISAGPPALGRQVFVVGPVGVVFPAATDLIPGYTTGVNITSSQSNISESDILNSFAAGFGGALKPQVPNETDIRNVMYRDATLRISINPMHYSDANPRIENPEQMLCVVDLVSGTELNGGGVYRVEKRERKDENGEEIEYGILEVNMTFGKGVWAGGWGGGGAFAVGVRGWVESCGVSIARGGGVWSVMWVVIVGWLVGLQVDLVVWW
ncbi:hypothetical protein BDZ91DRAFT_847047 [Kalaharituber pfeilii]|nr:hypothetical protein BDZ91DRAFT_847047 [Kalaharituber pfeilii]